MSSVDLYNNIYGDFASDAEGAVRRETYGEDIGQSSWMTADAWLGYADRVQAGPGKHVLEVCSGSGGPAVYLAAKRGCQVTGVDINEHGIANAKRLAEAHGVADRVTFLHADANKPLPFDDGEFDAILSNDAICHLSKRLEVLRDWHRLLKPGGRLLFTDAMIVTGPISNEELATRSSIGFYLFLPPGENERQLQAAGFKLLAAEDTTGEAAVVAGRWHDARERHREALEPREGEANFDGLQRFLACVRTVSEERRLSRVAYLGKKHRV